MKDEIKDTVQVLPALMIWPVILLILWIVPHFVAAALIGGFILVAFYYELTTKSLRERIRRYWSRR